MFNLYQFRKDLTDPILTTHPLPATLWDLVDLTKDHGAVLTDQFSRVVRRYDSGVGVVPSIGETFNPNLLAEASEPDAQV